MKSFKRKALFGLGLAAGAYAGVSIHFERKILSRDKEQHAYNPVWLRQVDYKEMWIKSKDHLKLRGLYIHNPHALVNRTVVIAHGYHRQIERMDDYGQGFFNMGYHVLMIDLRTHGLSEGKTITFGKRESDDVLLWLDEIKRINNETSFILFGLSMGAATMIHAASKATKYPIVALIEDCGFSRFDMLVEGQVVEQKLKPWIVPGFKWALRWRLRSDLSRLSPIYALKHVHVPFMIIHGDKDTLIPVEMAYDLCRHALGQPTMLICQGKGHAQCIEDESYFEAIRLFLKERA